MSNSFWTLSWTFLFSLSSTCVCEPNTLLDNTWVLLKLANESWAGIWKLPEKLSDLGGGGWNELRNPSDGSEGWISAGAGGHPAPWPGASTDGDGGGERLLLCVRSCLCVNLLNWFLRAKSIPDDPDACFIRSHANFFFQHQAL